LPGVGKAGNMLRDGPVACRRAIVDQAGRISGPGFAYPVMLPFERFVEMGLGNGILVVRSRAIRLVVNSLAPSR